MMLRVLGKCGENARMYISASQLQKKKRSGDYNRKNVIIMVLSGMCAFTILVF